MSSRHLTDEALLLCPAWIVLGSEVAQVRRYSSRYRAPLTDDDTGPRYGPPVVVEPTPAERVAEGLLRLVGDSEKRWAALAKVTVANRGKECWVSLGEVVAVL